MKHKMPNSMIENHIPRKAGGDVLRRIKALKIGQKMQDLPEELWHKSFRFYVKEDPTRVGGPNLRMIRLDPEKPSLTVTGYIFNKFVHPYEDRFVTVREAARLQGFPDDFRFVGTLTSTQMQVGNAVPVQLAAAVARTVLTHAIEHQVFSATQLAQGLPALSLFSGAGGLDIGVATAKTRTAKWNVLGCVERDHDCCNTLRANFGKKSLVIEADITTLDPHQVLAECGLESDLSLLIGGPPCQAFSQAGKQKGTQDPRGTMVFEYLRFLRVLKPMYFIMENVSGLRSAEKGGVLKGILAEMEALGYTTSCGLLCAADYGAPQLRQRLFFVGVRNGYPAVPLPRRTHAQDPGSGEMPYVGIGKAFQGVPRVEEIDAPEVYQATLSIAERRARYLKAKQGRRAS